MELWYHNYEIGCVRTCRVPDGWQNAGDQEFHKEQPFAPRTLWRLHNAFTEALKGNLGALPSRTRRLQGLLDPVADFAPAVVTGQG